MGHVHCCGNQISLLHRGSCHLFRYIKQVSGRNHFFHITQTKDTERNVTHASFVLNKFACLFFVCGLFCATFAHFFVLLN